MSQLDLRAPPAMQHEINTATDPDVRQLLGMSPAQIDARVDALLLSPNGMARMFKILFRLLIVVARRAL